MRAFEYVDAASIGDAINLLQAEGNNRIIAGGTDLLVLMKDRLINPRTLINIKTIDGLDSMEIDDRGDLAIGPLATLSRLGEDQNVQSRFPLLREAIRVAASPQLRNVATLGGNLCQRPRCWFYRGSFECFLNGGNSCMASTCESRDVGIFGDAECYAVNPSDLAPALVALDALVTIQGPDRRVQIPIADFFTAPSKDFLSQNMLGHEQIIVEVRLPRQPKTARGIYLKAMERKAWSFAEASVAIQYWQGVSRLNDLRIVLGSVAPIPWRAKAAEDILRGEKLTANLIEAASQAAVADAKPRGKNAYKVALVRELVKRGLGELVG